MAWCQCQNENNNNVDISDRALEIVNEFTMRPLEQQCYPNNEYWLKKLCALAERCAKAEILKEQNEDNNGKE